MPSQTKERVIHPTAVVDSTARLAAGVKIGPYAVIGAEVEIGEDCRIGPHAVIDDHVRMGTNNKVFPGACIGQEPQDLKYGGAKTEVILGNDNTIRECVTINRATEEGGKTRLGSGNLLMAYTHLGHNCSLGDHIVIANNVAVAGHVEIGDRAVIGGVLGIHQFVQIGTLAMIGGMTRLDRDVPPFSMTEGHPGRIRGLNRIGLRRSGLQALDGGAQYRELKEIWDLLYHRGHVLAEGLRLARQRPLLAAAEELCGFLEASIRPGRRGPMPPPRC